MLSLRPPLPTLISELLSHSVPLPPPHTHTHSPHICPSVARRLLMGSVSLLSGGFPHVTLVSLLPRYEPVVWGREGRGSREGGGGNTSQAMLSPHPAFPILKGSILFCQRHMQRKHIGSEGRCVCGGGETDYKARGEGRKGKKGETESGRKE